MLNALTVDVEEHFHFCGLKTPLPFDELQRSSSLVVPQTERVLELLARTHVKATFFILGTVAERYPELIQHIAQEGHELASHGYRHELVYQMTPEAFERDVSLGLRALGAAVQVPILGYRAPSFSITKESLWAFGVLRRLGFRYDCSVFPIHHSRYGLPEASRAPHAREGLTEFPMSTLRVGAFNIPVAGGAYFRLLPFAVVRQAFRRLNREGIPGQFYVHPWELDETIPRLPVPWHRALTHYANLRQTRRRLEWLLEAFAFGPVRSVLGVHDS